MTDKPNPVSASDANWSSKNSFLSRRWVWIILSIAVLAGVAFYLAAAEDEIEITQKKEALPTQLVSIETLDVGPETVAVVGHAEIRPRWSAELRSAVTGRITKVMKSALSGQRVAAGTKLITIEDSQYIAELASANLALKEAKLALWKAKNKTTVARNMYSRDETKPPNDLSLFLPQLDIAKSSVSSAKAKVAAQQQQLNDTRIIAPFSGYVTERFVSPGQMLNVGEKLLRLVDDSAFEITVELSRFDWLLLKQPISGQNARVVTQQGKVVTQAKIRKSGGFLDEKTRQYKVFLDLEDLNRDIVLSGDFAKVILPGITIPYALNIPASALTQEGYIWNLDDENRLQRHTPQVLFRRDDRIIIQASKSKETWRIVITPLASFLPGQMVTPKEMEG